MENGLLSVELLHGDDFKSVVDNFIVDQAQMLEDEENTVAEFRKRAETAITTMAPNAAIKRLVYFDDEGDSCTFNKCTVKDAMTFILPPAPDTELKRLQLHVITEAKQDQQCFEYSPETRDSTISPNASYEECVLKELNTLASGTDMRCLVPRLARAALQIIEESEQPVLYLLIEQLAAIRDGQVNADIIPKVLNEWIPTIMQLPVDVRDSLVDRMREEANKVVAELQKDNSKKQSEDVEVHTRIACDGCETAPIIGKRYKSLERDNYDLCEQCFRSTERDLHMWVRVKSNVFGSVVSSYYAPPTSSQLGQPSHPGIICDGCDMSPIVGPRFKSMDSPDYDLCSACYQTRSQLSPEVASMRFEEIAPKITVHGSALAAYEAAEVKTTVETKDDDGMDEDEEKEEEQYEEEKEAKDEQHEENEKENEEEKTDEVKDDMSPEATEGQEDVATLEGTMDTLDDTSLKTILASLLRHSSPSVRSAVAAELRASDGMSVEETVSEDKEAVTQKIEEGTLPMETDWIMAEDKVEQSPVLSAAVLSSTPLILGIEALEDDAARGSVTEVCTQFAAATWCQGFRVGRVVIPAGTGTEMVPVCASCVVINNGQLPWPETTVLTLVEGDAFEFPHLQLGIVEPGVTKEIVMDFHIPIMPEPGTKRSAWAIIDAVTGVPLGPILFFEVVWTDLE